MMKPRVLLPTIIALACAFLVWLFLQPKDLDAVDAKQAAQPTLQPAAIREDPAPGTRNPVAPGGSEKVGNVGAGQEPDASVDSAPPLSRRERFQALSARLRPRPATLPSAPDGALGPAVARENEEAQDESARPVLDLGTGVQLPAIFLDETPGRTPQIQQAKENLARTFEEELTKELETIPVEDEEGTARAYHRARARSDELYRALFGEAAYMRLGIKKASEAVQSGGAAAASPDEP